MTLSSETDALHAQTVRNRENQRNFRSRRQQYIRELEDKVRAYEREQIQATQRVQNAARLVAFENRVLRDFIRQNMGLSEHDISNLVHQIQSADNTAPKDTVLSATHQLPVMSCEGTLVHGRMHADLKSRTKRTRKINPDIGHISEPKASSSETSTSLDDKDGCREDTTQSQRSDAMIRCTHEPGPDQMSCEEAAAIISGLRTGTSIADIRQELGCDATRDCKTYSSEIFQTINALI